MKKRFRLVMVGLLVFGGGGGLSMYSNAQEPPAIQAPAVPPAPEGRFFKLKDLRPGMTGVGHTVFKGDTISDFNVEILGVVDNFLPKQSAIFAKLSGGPLADTGVFAGMSGSPVFINGKLLGAVAYSFPFSKEAIAAITPIENMVTLTDGSSLRAGMGATGSMSSSSGETSYNSEQSVSQQVWNLVPLSQVSPTMADLAYKASENGLPNPAELKPIDTPLMLSGFPRAAIDYFMPQFRAMGLAPMTGGVMGGTDTPNEAMAEASDIGPGSGVGAQLVRGIFGATAAGKVTYREGNRIFAFGHPFLHSGPTDLPMTKTRLITVLPSLMSSTELSVPTELIGTIKEDRVSGIYGEVGVTPRMIPVTIRLRSSRNIQKTFRFETVNDRFLTPFLVNFTIFSALSSSERALGESTLEVQGTIALKGKQEVKVENFVSGDANSSVIASLSVANPVNFLLQSGLKDVQIDSITVDVTSWDEKRQAVLERIWTDRREVEAGDRLELSAVLRKTNGEEILVRLPVVIPEQTPPGPLMVGVMDGGFLSMLENRETRPTFLAKDVTQLIRTINQVRQNNRLYIRVTRPEQSFAIYGEAFPAVPPSLATLMLSDRTSGASQTTLRSSTLVTVEGPPLNLLLSGQRSITLSVVK
jgi:SpoIVB peptidase S55